MEEVKLYVTINFILLWLFFMLFYPMCGLFTEYIHMKTAPLVSSPQYQVLKVLINLTSDNIEGFGNPVFYQVQYKVSTYNRLCIYLSLEFTIH